jgi:mycothiol synthase
LSITIRPYVRGQDDEIRVDLYNRAHAEDDDFVPANVEENRRWDQSPYEANRSRFIAVMDGTPAGVVLCEADPERGDKKGFMYGPHVPPELRRRGVGTALARAAFADLRSRVMTRVEVEERDRADVIGFLGSLGFERARQFSEMQRSLADLPRGMGESAGAEIAVVDPTTENLALNVAIENEAFKEHYNYQPIKLDELEFWARNFAQEDAVLHMSFARVDGIPVGYLWYGFDRKEMKHLKKNRGGLWDLGVLKPWRGRGLAKALLLAAMEHLKSYGIEEVRLRVDDTNSTGAHRLYERLGFELVHRNLVHSLGLAPTSGKQEEN